VAAEAVVGKMVGSSLNPCYLSALALVAVCVSEGVQLTQAQP